MIKLTPNQKIIGLVVGGGLVVVIGIVLYFAFIKKDTPKTTPKSAPKSTPKSTPKTLSTPTSNSTNINTDLREVYYSDNGSTSATHYAFTFTQASDHARLRGGTVATPEQLREAHSKGLDVCSYGWANDGKIYTVSQKTHGYGSYCQLDYLGVKERTDSNGKGGVWVYGIKPFVSNCKTPNIASSCVLPFSTITDKWSQYDKHLQIKGIRLKDGANIDYTENFNDPTKYETFITKNGGCWSFISQYPYLGTDVCFITEVTLPSDIKAIACGNSFVSFTNLCGYKELSPVEPNKTTIFTGNDVYSLKFMKV